MGRADRGLFHGKMKQYGNKISFSHRAYVNLLLMLFYSLLSVPLPYFATAHDPRDLYRLPSWPRNPHMMRYGL